ncbi:acyl-CoA thioesterase [Enterococcus faecalis]
MDKTVIEIKGLYTLQPRFSDFDSYGIAHHGKYLYWLEEARFDFIRKYFGEDEEHSIHMYKFPLTNQYLKYIKSFKPECTVAIRYNLKGDLISNKFQFFYRLFDNKNQLCCKGMTTHVLLDDKGNLVKELPDVISDRLIKIDFTQKNTKDAED